MTFWPGADTWWQLTSNKSQCLLDNRHMSWHGICMTFWPAGDIHTCGLTIDNKTHHFLSSLMWESEKVGSCDHTLTLSVGGSCKNEISHFTKRREMLLSLHYNCFITVAAALWQVINCIAGKRQLCYHSVGVVIIQWVTIFLFHSATYFTYFDTVAEDLLPLLFVGTSNK